MVKSRHPSRLAVFTERFTLLRGDMTQTQFADMLGLSRPTVSLYESGERIPDAVTLRIIAEKCNVSADYLLGLREDPTTDRDVQFVSDYTGLPGDAIEKLHSFAHWRKDKYGARYLENFGRFVMVFYDSFLDTLENLRDYSEDADKELLEYFSKEENTEEQFDFLQATLEGLQRELFVFSRMCDKIPGKLFDTEELLEQLERESNRLQRIHFEKSMKMINSDNDLPF